MSAHGGLHSTEGLQGVNLPNSSKPTTNPDVLSQYLGLITCPNLDRFSWETQKDYPKFRTQCMKAQKNISAMGTWEKVMHFFLFSFFFS